jgi:hypothetical protein
MEWLLFHLVLPLPACLTFPLAPQPSSSTPPCLRTLRWAVKGAYLFTPLHFPRFPSVSADSFILFFKVLRHSRK